MKPKAICLRPEAILPEGLRLVDTSPKDFAEAWQSRLADEVAQLGLNFRRASLDDLAAIDALHGLGFSDFSTAMRPSRLEFYRLLRFGLGIALVDSGGALRGYSLLHLSADGTAVSAGIVIHPEWTRRGLGVALTRYGSLAAMALGAKRRRGTVRVVNYSSLAVFLNHLGGLCDFYHPQLMSHGEGRLEYLVPLTPENLSCFAIDEEALERFVKEGREGIDYRLAKVVDGPEIEALFCARPVFHPVAVARAGRLAENALVVALPVSLVSSAEETA